MPINIKHKSGLSVQAEKPPPEVPPGGFFVTVSNQDFGDLARRFLRDKYTDGKGRVLLFTDGLGFVADLPKGRRCVLLHELNAQIWTWLDQHAFEVKRGNILAKFNPQAGFVAKMILPIRSMLKRMPARNFLDWQMDGIFEAAG